MVACLLCHAVAATIVAEEAACAAVVIHVAMIARTDLITEVPLTAHRAIPITGAAAVAALVVSAVEAELAIVAEVIFGAVPGKLPNMIWSRPTRA